MASASYSPKKAACPAITAAGQAALQGDHTKSILKTEPPDGLFMGG
jgi:hypothetical protein